MLQSQQSVAQPDDLMQGLSDQLEGFGIRSEQSQQRLLHRRIKEKPVQPSTFYGSVTGAPSSSSITSFGLSSPMKLSGNRNTLLMEGEEEDEDSTYEESEEKTSSLETEEFTEECSMEHEEGYVDMCIPADEVVLLRADNPDFDDGASDYCASDAGEGPDDIPDDLTCSSPPPKSKQASIEKYCSRAANMLANPAVQINEWHGLPFNAEYWVCRMARFNKRENRWVDKGPVMIYFIAESNQPVRLYGNFLYGTKSVCLDMQIYELLEKRCKLLAGVYFVFSTMGYNATRHADIRPEKVGGVSDASHSIPLYACRSVVTNVQETGSTVFTLKFLNQEVINRFIQVLGHHVEGVKRSEMMKRFNSFMLGTEISGKCPQLSKHIPIYSTNSKFVEDMSRIGIQYAPFVEQNIPSAHQQVIETVECSWCKVKMGPFSDLPNIASVQKQSHLQQGKWCPWKIC